MTGRGIGSFTLEFPGAKGSRLVNDMEADSPATRNLLREPRIRGKMVWGFEGSKGPAGKAGAGAAFRPGITGSHVRSTLKSLKVTQYEDASRRSHYP